MYAQMDMENSYFDIVFAVVINFTEFIPLLPGLWIVLCSKTIRKEMLAIRRMTISAT
jgi:hypothetical protein